MNSGLSRRDFLGACLAASAVGALGPRRAFGQAQRRPNLVVFLADDLGYADLGCQGCRDIPTPHCDALAADGVRCTDGHATHPVCSPSRAGLLSGRYQHRFGFEHNSGPERYAADNFGLPTTVPTLAERLKAAGYATGMVGKWHVGFKPGLRPHERGFDEHFGFLSGARTYLPGKPDVDPLVRNGEPVTDEQEYLTDAFAREACGFIDRGKGRPFFLYVAFNAVHAPLEATRAYEDRVKDITDPKRRTYGGMLVAMDDAVGRVMAKLDEHHLTQNTLVVFYSDNGGPTPQTTSRNDPLRGTKGQMFEGGHRVPFILQWPGKLTAGQVYAPMLMGFDVHATALAAAGVSAPEDQPLDGVDLRPHLTGETAAAPHETLFWRAARQHAARVGPWKLVNTGREPQPMLFNLAEDLSEQRDLAAAQPAKLAELQDAYRAWSAQMMPAQWQRQDARTQGGGGGNVEARFRRADRNGDGVVTPDELRNAQTFRRLDRNGDGKITLVEATAGAGGGDDDE